MPNIPREKIESILSATDIVEIVSEHLPLKKAGSNFKGLCPFHGEKTPSFVVTPSKQIYYCFGCHMGGDAISFLTKIENMSFVEAVKKLADRAGITVEQEDTSQAAADPKQIYFRINSYAQWFFQQQAAHSDLAGNYLKERGLSAEMTELFELGFAPDGFSSLVNFFETKKIPLEKAIELGVLKRGERGHVYDFFRNRLMFPIRSGKGDMIGFGGRTLSQKADEAKYINSSESPVYHKSRELYGLYHAKKTILKSRQVVIVEGYIDAIACVQMGLTNTVAPLGTSLTIDQLGVLTRFAEDVVLMFDGDRAGQKAALKSVQLCLEQGIHPRVAVLEDQTDPGDYLKNNNYNNLLNIVHKAPLAMDWILSLAVNTASARPGDRAKTVVRLLEWIARLPTDVERQTYKKQIEQYFGVFPGKMNKVIENKKEFDMSQSLRTGRLSLDEMMVLAFLLNPRQFEKAEGRELVNYLEDSSLKELAVSVKKNCENHETFAGTFSIRQLPEKDMNLAARLLACAPQTMELNVESLEHKLKRRFARSQLRQITAEILDAQTRQDGSALKDLLMKKQRLLKNAAVQN